MRTAHSLVRIAPGILTVAASELLPAYLLGVSNEAGKHGDAKRADQGIIEALFGSEAHREEPHSREFVAVTGYHRKHAMRVLRGGCHGLRPGRRVYGDAVREAILLHGKPLIGSAANG